MTDGPKQPEAPATPNGGDHSGSAHAEHGIPPEAHTEEPTALPTSDRHQQENAPVTANKPSKP